MQSKDTQRDCAILFITTFSGNQPKDPILGMFTAVFHATPSRGTRGTSSGIFHGMLSNRQAWKTLRFHALGPFQRKMFRLSWNQDLARSHILQTWNHLHNVPTWSHSPWNYTRQCNPLPEEQIWSPHKATGVLGSLYGCANILHSMSYIWIHRKEGKNKRLLCWTVSR